MDKFKILIIGPAHLSSKQTPAGGQEVKVRAFFNHFSSKFGKKSVFIVDTTNWKKHIIKVLFRLLYACPRSANIVLMPGKNGIRILSRICLILKRRKSKMFLLAIGGWLPSITLEKPSLSGILKKFDLIAPEMEYMKKSLEEQGFKNVSVIRNARPFVKLKKKQIKRPSGVIKACTFSRIAQGKGVDFAIKIILEANKRLGYRAYCLDVYGAPQGKYGHDIIASIDCFSPIVNYRGIVDAFDTQKTLTKYDLLLFFTSISSEGFPGTVLDAYHSGLCLIGFDTVPLKELIVNGETGFIVGINDYEAAVSLLVRLAKNQDKIFDLKINSLVKSGDYDAEKIFSKFDSFLL